MRKQGLVYEKKLCNICGQMIGINGCAWRSHQEAHVRRGEAQWVRERYYDERLIPTPPDALLECFIAEINELCCDKSCYNTETVRRFAELFLKAGG